MKVDSLINARWLIPIEPAQCVLENHAIAINAGKIVDIQPRTLAAERYQADKVYQLDEHAVLPGLINSHTHAAMSLFRGMADDLPLMDWLNEHIWPAEQRWISPEFVEDGSRLAIAEMIRSGTTCFADMYFFADISARIAVEAGIRAVIGLIVIDFPSAWASNTDEYLLKAGQVHHKFRNTPLIRTAFSPHSPYAVSESALSQLNTLAEELDIPIMMHIHETADEIRQSLAEHGKRPLQRLEALGMLSPRLLAIHMTQLDDGELDMLQRYGVHIVHCPQSNLKLASGFCPVQELHSREVNIAIGTDGAASNNDLDMLAELQTTALLAKGVSGNPQAIDAFTALKMATINGAVALGLDDHIGSLVNGKQADIIAVNLSDFETQPLGNPVSQLVYAGNRSQVSHTWVAGQCLMQERKLQTLNENEIRQSSKKWQEKLYG